MEYNNDVQEQLIQNRDQDIRDQFPESRNESQVELIHSEDHYPLPQANIQEHEKEDKLIQVHQIAQRVLNNIIYPTPSVEIQEDGLAMVTQNVVPQGENNQRILLKGLFSIATPYLTQQEYDKLIEQSQEVDSVKKQFVSNWEQFIPGPTIKFNKIIKDQGFGHAMSQYLETLILQLTEAYKKAGFSNFSQEHAYFQTLGNLIKRSQLPILANAIFTGRKSNSISEQDYQKDDTQLKKFFMQTTPYYMSEESRYPQKNVQVNVKTLKIFYNSCSAGDLDEPSIVLDFGSLDQDQAFFQTLKNWFNQENFEFGEIEFNFGLFDPESGYPSNSDLIRRNMPIQENMRKNVALYLQMFEKQTPKSSAFIFRGTTSILSQQYRSSPKYIDIFLKQLLNSKQNCRLIRKLNISYNYISCETLEILANIMQNSPRLKELDLSGCVLGMQAEIITTIVKVPLQDLTCTQMMKEFLLGHLDFWKGCLFAPCYTWCCPIKYHNTQQGYSTAKNKIEIDQQAANQFETLDFTPLVIQIKKRPLDKILLTNMNLVSLAKTSQINELLEAIGFCNIISVSLSGTGLNDLHVMGIIKIFLLSRRLMHIDLENLCFGLNSYDMIDKAIKTCPFIISMAMSNSGRAEYFNYINISRFESSTLQEVSKCCISTMQGNYMQQRQNIPIDLHNSNFDEYIKSILEETRSHRIIDSTNLVNYLSQNDEKHKKRLWNQLMKQYQYLNEYIFSERKKNYLDEWWQEVRKKYFSEELVDVFSTIRGHFDLDSIVQKVSNCVRTPDTHLKQ